MGIFSIFILGFFWKRTTGSAAFTGIITGFVMPVIFNNYAAAWFGHEILYTAYPNGHRHTFFDLYGSVIFTYLDYYSDREFIWTKNKS